MSASSDEQIAQKLKAVMELLQMILADHREAAADYGACRRGYELAMQEIRILRDQVQRNTALMAADELIAARAKGGPKIDELINYLSTMMQSGSQRGTRYDEHVISRWQFWTAVVTLVGSTIAAITGLVVSLLTAK